MLNTGDKVTIKDWSFALIFRDNKFRRTTVEYKQSNKATVLCTGVILPVHLSLVNELQMETIRNDTIIRWNYDGSIILIHHEFLRPQIHTIVIDNKTIEISDESYNNLKKQLTC